MGDQGGSKKGCEERMVRDPKTCGGEPVLRRTRVTLPTVVASLVAGDTAKDIVADFSTLKPEDIQAGIALAPSFEFPIH